MEDYARRCGEWLQAQISRAEAHDPLLQPLKERINSLGKAIDVENNSGAETNDLKINALLREQEDAIFKLIQHIAQRANGSSAP